MNLCCVQRQRFDSILVRLKAKQKQIGTLEGEIRFDSILVRLKDKISHLLSEVQTKFRFHTGSIKSRLKRLRRSLERGFDSILVRLKER